MNRYFRISNDAIYEANRLALDVAFGHRPPVTCVDPAEVAPRDASGRILLAVRGQFCAFPAVAEMLPGLLRAGLVEELTAEQYASSLTTPSP